ncbi:hypothetical protein [Streptomyces venezuelae]|uniref:hypothetical protein n=1 Tax=Streptomyces venezuelae TaxID=54571 RepID=UPI0009030505|nr:hypothetical protein [Streptomyces venezuelae]APE26747.1 hypothetical protein vnz_37155 [Streptomyces venezuelae]
MSGSEISVGAQDVDRLLHGPASEYGAPFQRAYAELAETRRGRPADEIVPLHRTAADRSLLGFTGADLFEQAQAIGSDGPYGVRVRVTDL